LTDRFGPAYHVPNDFLDTEKWKLHVTYLAVHTSRRVADSKPFAGNENFSFAGPGSDWTGYETAEAAGSFLNASLNDLHPPELLPGIDEAAERVVSAVRSNGGSRFMEIMMLME
jgi:hypothetical protein